MPSGRIVVVGLGPGGEQHVTLATHELIDAHRHRFLRTSRHPSAHVVPDATSFDDRYETASSFDAVYESIADDLVDAAARHGEVLYAVPGSPLVLERTVRLLQRRDEIELTIEPAMSFLDVAWARLGIDPVEESVRLVDAHDFAVAAAGERGPLLIAHAHADWVLSEVKLAAEEAADERVIILQALGTDAERVVETSWADLDRSVHADHLTSIYVPELAAPVGSAYVRFHGLTRTLREQCPWDVEQTHRTLVPYLLEETYEVVDAIEELGEAGVGDELLIEELGDLLYQIEFHATIAEQEGRFTIADVADGIHDKLVRRHPHVFGDVAVEGTDDVLANWDDIKRAEKGRTSRFDGIPRSLPALSYAAKVGRKAAEVGFDWPDRSGPLAKIREELDELTRAADGEGDVRTAEELGDVLFAVVNLARHLDADPELALRAAGDRFRRRFEAVETLAARRDLDLATADVGTLDLLWEEVKRAGT